MKLNLQVVFQWILKALSTVLLALLVWLGQRVERSFDELNSNVAQIKQEMAVQRVGVQHLERRIERLEAREETRGTGR